MLTRRRISWGFILLTATWSVWQGTDVMGARPERSEGERQREGGEARPERERPNTEGFEEGLELKGGEPGAAIERYRLPNRWRLGVYAYNTSAGVVISRVVENSTAATAGLEAGDVIVTVKGFQVGYVDDRKYNLGDELQLRADRSGRALLLVNDVRGRGLVNMPVTLEHYPQPPIIRERGSEN